MYSNETICDILIYIDKNIFNKIDIDNLAKFFYINRYYLMRLFKKEMSITINNYINCLKINKSLKFLQNNTVLNAALNNGFSSQEYFSEMFKKIIGVSPTSYKKFVNHNKNISNSSIEIIRNSIIELNTILDKKNNYLLNRKPDTSITKFPSL